MEKFANLPGGSKSTGNAAAKAGERIGEKSSEVKDVKGSGKSRPHRNHMSNLRERVNSVFERGLAARQSHARYVTELELVHEISDGINKRNATDALKRMQSATATIRDNDTTATMVAAISVNGAKNGDLQWKLLDLMARGTNLFAEAANLMAGDLRLSGASRLRNAPGKAAERAGKRAAKKASRRLVPEVPVTEANGALAETGSGSCTETPTGTKRRRLSN